MKLLDTNQILNDDGVESQPNLVNASKHSLFLSLQIMHSITCGVARGNSLFKRKTKIEERHFACLNGPIKHLLGSP